MLHASVLSPPRLDSMAQARGAIEESDPASLFTGAGYQVLSCKHSVCLYLTCMFVYV